MLYCGVKHQIIAGFDFNDTFLHLKDLEKGMLLVDEGISLAENGISNKNLDFWDYCAIGDAYANSWHQGMKTGTYNIDDQINAVKYWKLGLDLDTDGELGDEITGLIKEQIELGEKIIAVHG